MATFTRGFGGRRDDRDDTRIPPGQTLVRDWHVEGLAILSLIHI